MFDRLFGNQTIGALRRGLDAAVLRHQAIASNLANVETPGYKRKEVAFEDTLSRALEQGEPTGQTVPRLRTVSDTAMRLDGNNVDPAAEMVELAQNQIRHQAMTQMVAGYYSSLKSVISGR